MRDQLRFPLGKPFMTSTTASGAPLTLA
jgi:hypothetical protein